MKITNILEASNNDIIFRGGNKYSSLLENQKGIYLGDNAGWAFSSMIEFDQINSRQGIANVKNGVIFIIDDSNRFSSITIREVEGHSACRFTNKQAIKTINFQKLIDKVFEGTAHQFRVNLRPKELSIYSKRQVGDNYTYLNFECTIGMLGFYPLEEKLTDKLKTIIKKLQNIQKIGDSTTSEHLKFLNYLADGSYTSNSHSTIDIPSSSINKIASIFKNAEYTNLLNSQDKITDDVESILKQMTRINDAATASKYKTNMVINIKGLVFNIYNPQAFKKIWVSVPCIRNVELGSYDYDYTGMLTRMVAYVHMVGEYNAFRNKLNRFQLSLS